MSRKRIEVAAAVLLKPDGRFLLAQRPAGKVYAGYWEFPGGKVEPGERADEALARELHEELGIDVEQAYPWLTRDYEYEHAAVRLRFFRVTRWHGELHGREQQRFAWQRMGAPDVSPVLPANGPILDALALPPVYGISNAGELGIEPFLARLEAALQRGLRLVQLREKELAPKALSALAARVMALARQHGARVLVNGELELARSAGADGVHWTAAQLMRASSRPDCTLAAASCHNEDELAHAAALGLDFVVLGPVHPTISHPGAPTLGWARCASLIADYPLPVYALGGMRMKDVERAWLAGAHGIATMRDIWRVSAA
ncbi:MAG TPA: Nudix family hydrolase [Burkholderiales bacterium]|jgi:Thiamine monophosphate synthase